MLVNEMLLKSAMLSLSETMLVMDVMALHRMQRTPDCFFIPHLNQQRKYNEERARRLVWC